MGGVDGGENDLALMSDGELSFARVTVAPGVKKNLMAVSSLLNTGHQVSYDPKGSYSEWWKEMVYLKLNTSLSHTPLQLHCCSKIPELKSALWKQSKFNNHPVTGSPTNRTLGWNCAPGSENPVW